MLDIESELTIRGEEPPHDAAKAEREIVRRTVADQFDRLKSDPQRLAEFNEGLVEDMLEFFDSISKGREN
jgi:hypothetical protein